MQITKFITSYHFSWILGQKDNNIIFAGLKLCHFGMTHKY